MLAPAAVHAQWQPRLEGGVSYDSNFTRGQMDRDVVGDYSLQARGALARTFDVGERGSLSASLEARAVQYAHFDRASFVALGVGGGYRHKLGLGRSAPWVLADASASYDDARDPVRDVTRYAGSLALAARLGERLEASIGAAYDRSVQRRGDLARVAGVSGKVFSLQGRSLFARASYALGERLSLLAGASLRHGDVESTTHRNPVIFAASSAIALDPAIGPDFVAYRLSGARTKAVTLGLSYELDRRSALSATLSADDTRARNGLAYRGAIMTLGYEYRR